MVVASFPSIAKWLFNEMASTYSLTMYSHDLFYSHDL